MTTSQYEDNLKQLSGHRLVVAVTGGIAAYKTCELVSKLVQAGAQVRVIMTENARHFVGETTFQALTGHPVVSEMFGELPEVELDHISVAQFAQVIAVVPATANVLGKVASGICDDLVTTTINAAAGPVVFAPAMNQRMWDNPITQRNVGQLQELGYHFVEPEEGWLACGEVGVGRLADTEKIVAAIVAALYKPGSSTSLSGKRILITAGPTREYLDPIRFISNPSSGKMGFALARTALKRGAAVTVVAGPVSASPPPGVEPIAVESAEQMKAAVMSRLAEADVFVSAAAVANFKPAQRAAEKISKSSQGLDLHLAPTPDILAAASQSDDRPAVVVGFAAETENLEENARRKLQEKNLDLIVANDLKAAGAGFAADTNEVIILRRDGSQREVSRRLKTEVAAIILTEIEQLLKVTSDINPN